MWFERGRGVVKLEPNFFTQAQISAIALGLFKLRTKKNKYKNLTNI
jgi:hypothetical protein